MAEEPRIIVLLATPQRRCRHARYEMCGGGAACFDAAGYRVVLLCCTLWKQIYSASEQGVV